MKTLIVSARTIEPNLDHLENLVAFHGYKVLNRLENIGVLVVEGPSREDLKAKLGPDYIIADNGVVGVA